MESSSFAEDVLLLPDIPAEEQPQYLVPSFEVPQCGIDADGDVEMTEAPPMEFDVIPLLQDIRLLAEGTLAIDDFTRAMHNVTQIMLERVKCYV